MADRMEREIEEILSKLDVEPAANDRAPVSIMSKSKSKKKKPRPAPATVSRIRNWTAISNPALLLLAGAGIMVAGLILSNVWSPLIWMAFGGVVIFLGAFVLSFRKGPRNSGGESAGPQGHYWRDRYIEYQPQRGDILSKLKHRFRR